MRIPRPATRCAAVLALAVLMLSACGVTRTDSAPLHRLKMLVANSAGSGYDQTARAAIKVLENDDITGRIQVLNVVGAGGSVAMARLMNEVGNGDRMMMMGLGVVGAGYTNGSPNKVTDATPLAKLVEEQEVLVVPADSPFKTLDDLVKAWKADPPAINVGGGSLPGGPDHLFPMQTAQAVGINSKAVNYISYDGGSDLMTALLGKKVDVGATGVGEVVDQIEAGQLRALAVSGSQRDPNLDAPTLTEAGVPLTFTNWRGVLAPPGISASARTAMIDALTEMHKAQGWKDALALHGWGDAFITGEDFEKFLREQDHRVASTLTELGLT